jgi:hypothetical protein
MRALLNPAGRRFPQARTSTQCPAALACATKITPPTPAFPTKGVAGHAAPDSTKPPLAIRGSTDPVEKPLLVTIFIVFALLIGSAITAYRSTHEVLEVLQATLLALKDVEAGSRGYGHHR